MTDLAAFTTQERAAFAAAAAPAPHAAALVALAKALKSAGPLAGRAERLDLAAAFAHAAFASPDHVAAVYDAAAQGWSGRPPNAKPIAPLVQPPEPIDAALWADFWPLAEDAANGRVDAASITARTAALGAHVDPSHQARVIAAAYSYRGVRAAANGPWPARIDLATLAACPAGSLGRRFHDLIVDNRFDLEVLDRDALGLKDLPAPLGYLNTRILQAHDLWHIVAGNETTALHEIAISAFQMAQFGHAYSAMFLAVTTTALAAAPAPGFGLVMDVIVSAWTHGRETPPMIAIPWEDVWTASAEEIRARYGVTAYRSPYPADLLEQLRPAA